MKVFSLFAVLFLTTQTPVPIPRQSVGSATSTRAAVENEAKKNNAPTAPPMPVIDPASSPGEENHRGEQRDDNQPQSVAIRELPPVSVTKDLSDWGLWVFSLLLVVVGSAQALYVAKTLSASRDRLILLIELS